MKLIVNGEKCPHNHKCPCVAVCAEGAITQKDDASLPQIDETRCVLCGRCVNHCPKGAIERAQ